MWPEGPLTMACPELRPTCRVPPPAPEPPGLQVAVPGVPVGQYPDWLPAFVKKPKMLLYAGIAAAAVILLLFGALLGMVMRRKNKRALPAAAGEDGQKAIAGGTGQA